MAKTIFDRLTEDHDRHRTLLDILSKTEGDSSDRAELWEKLKTDLVDHAKAEERAFYTELLGVRKSQDKASHSIKEHEEMESQIQALDDMDRSSSQWLIKLKELKEKVEHHEAEEEEDVYPVAREVLDDAQQERMVEVFNECKAEEQQDR